MLSGSDIPGSFPHCQSFHHVRVNCLALSKDFDHQTWGIIGEMHCTFKKDTIYLSAAM